MTHIGKLLKESVIGIAPFVAAIFEGLHKYTAMPFWMRMLLIAFCAIWAMYFFTMRLMEWIEPKILRPIDEKKRSKRTTLAAIFQACIAFSASIVSIVTLQLGAVTLHHSTRGDDAYLTIYAPLSAVRRLVVPLPTNAKCRAGNVNGRASADWIPDGTGGINPQIELRDFSFPEALRIACPIETMPNAPRLTSEPAETLTLSRSDIETGLISIIGAGVMLWIISFGVLLGWALRPRSAAQQV